MQLALSYEVETVHLAPESKARVCVELCDVGDLHGLRNLHLRAVLRLRLGDVELCERVWTVWVEAEAAFPRVESG